MDLVSHQFPSPTFCQAKLRHFENLLKKNLKFKKKYIILSNFLVSFAFKLFVLLNKKNPHENVDKL